MSEKTKQLPADQSNNTVTLTVAESIKLNAELNDMAMEEDLDFDIKYDIAFLVDKTATIVRHFTKQRAEIYKKYGKKKQGETEWSLEGSKDIDLALEQLEKLMEKGELFEKELKFADFKDLKSGKSYVQIFKLMKK